MDNNQAKETIKQLQDNMTEVRTSNECLKHTIYDVTNKIDIVDPIKLMDFKDGGPLKCPRCEKIKDDERYMIDFNVKRSAHIKKVRKETLYKKSIYSDKTLENATFKNYINELDELEVAENRAKVLKIIKNYAHGNKFITMFKGNTGVGKSHLSLSILKNLNEMIDDVSCVFISTRMMMDLIIDSYKNPDTMYSKQYFIDLCTRVDYLVLDDLGAETGAINTSKQATDHTQGVMTAILEGRLGKSTIVTTNLSRTALEDMYDDKAVSRALHKSVTVVFENTVDKRISEFELEDL